MSLERLDKPNRHERRAIASGHRVSFSIDEFCERNSISRSFFYKMKKLGLGPRITVILGKQIITETDESIWQAERAEAA